jgi:hypothetical protein
MKTKKNRKEKGSIKLNGNRVRQEGKATFSALGIVFYPEDTGSKIRRNVLTKTLDLRFSQS